MGILSFGLRDYRVGGGAGEPVTPTDTLRAVFDRSRRAWTRPELAAETGLAPDTIKASLTTLIDDGAVIRTDGRFRATSATPRVSGRGHAPAFDDTERARVEALLPATIAELRAKTGRSYNAIAAHLRAIGASPGANWVWSREPIGKPSRVHHPVLRTAGDEYACLESSTQRAVETQPTTDGFNCERRRIFVTLATCYDDHTTAAARQRGHVGVCRTCLRGQQLRAEYAQGV